MFERYVTQMALPEIGLEGQKILHKTSVFCVGAGGLACAALPYLVGAGIGTIAICDHDSVALSNLHRQVLYREKDIGLNKSSKARAYLMQLNSAITIIDIPTQITADNVLNLIKTYDYILDATDNFSTKLLLNDACYTLNKPLVSASVQGFKGHCSVYWKSKGPCLRCIFPDLAKANYPTCSSQGVLGMMPAWLGLRQAFEIIRLSLGFAQNLVGKLWAMDLQSTSQIISLGQNPDCPLCTGKENFVSLWHQRKLERCSMQLQQISVQELATLLETESPFLLDVRNPEEHNLFNLGGHLVPLSELSARLEEIPRDKPIIVYCRSGYRSQIALEFLQSVGITQVKNLVGGVLAWQHTYPVNV